MPLSIVKPKANLRTEMFKTSRRDWSSLGPDKLPLIKIAHTLTIPHPAIDAAFIDLLDAQRGYFSASSHYLVRMNGVVEVMRDPNTISTRFRNETNRTISIAVVGGLDYKGNLTDTSTDAQNEAIEELIQLITDQLGVPCEVAERRSYRKNQGDDNYDNETEEGNDTEEGDT